jgi:2-dehydro-3-deoxygalactonokinase
MSEQTLPPTKQLLAIDWGTSNRRAYLFDASGKVAASHADGQGLLAVGRDFPASLAALRATMQLGDDVPVVMSGMVGSASGWIEVPYLDASVPLAELPSHLAPVPGHANCWIVPGYCTRETDVDVMRGEETQLLGVVAQGQADGWVVLPGTHSKWVYLRGGVVQKMSTFMTGEMFAMLAANGTLSALMAPAPDDDAAFVAGLDEAKRGKPLTNALFGVRARVVTKSMPAAAARSFVSGLLIGTEFVAARSHADESISLVASHALSGRYADAAAHFGMAARVLDPDQVYCAAMQRFLRT